MAGDVSNCRDGCPGADVAALAFRGREACLNFADSAWSLPVPVSKDSMEIRREIFLEIFTIILNHRKSMLLL